MSKLVYSYTCQVNMDSNGPGNNDSSDTASNGLQRAQPFHWRTGGPMRRCTEQQWTPEEDKMLGIAVQRFNNWKKIAECLKGRTELQCLHRWVDVIKGPWLSEEDLVKKYGQEKRSITATLLPGPTVRRCRQRFRCHPYFNVNKDAWTREKDLALVQARQIYGDKLAELTKCLPGRRTSGLLQHPLTQPWTAEEDEMLRIAVQCFELKNWKQIGREMISSLQPCTRLNWAKIEECFKDRTEFECVVRWRTLSAMDLVKGPWFKEEDEVIIELVKKYGQERWCTIAAHLPGRTDKECRERWHNHLNLNINNEAWTQDEELALICAHQIYGNNWSELTKFLPGRTENAVKNQWNSSVEKKLDMYVASGLISKFRGLSLVSCPNHSAASSSSEAKHSEDYSFVKGGAELRSHGEHRAID